MYWFVAEWQEDIRRALSGIVKDKDMYVRVAAIAVLSGLGVQGMDYVTIIQSDILNLLCK